DLLAGAMMLLFSRADETIELYVQPFIHVLEPKRIACRNFLRRQFFGFRSLHHLQTVLVGASEKENVLAVEPRKARQRIGRDRLIGVADMRHAVRVCDRGRDVIDVSARRRRGGRNGREVFVLAVGGLFAVLAWWPRLLRRT